jgi:hypothetical protein
MLNVKTRFGTCLKNKVAYWMLYSPDFYRRLQPLQGRRTIIPHEVPLADVELRLATIIGIGWRRHRCLGRVVPATGEC